ncbi:MAG: type I-C CRISPR-associated protein Cas8c/Csd1, partial [Oscillospiraceae bacterium]|nr:type I-C CRISPR-associated protein Cas8c/Csd1 [Oscillospiraceae bacterium]
MTKQFLVPREGGRTSGDRTFFFYDKADYVFGLNTPETKAPWSLEKLKIRRDLFQERVRQCAEATGDEAAQKLLVFLENVAKGNETIALPEKMTSTDLFAFVYEPDDDILMTEREKIKNYWKRLRSPGDTNPTEHNRQCLVTGNDCGKIGLFPLIKKIPGGTTSGVGLVSFNAKAFESYGWSSNENAPVCREAAEACSTALNRLVDPAPLNPNDPSTTLPRQNVKLSANTVACYWNRGKSKFSCEVGGLFGPDPEKIGELYRSIWKGKMPSIEENDEFYALTITGTQGRAILRDWFESTIDQVQEKLCLYFKDIEISRNNRSLKNFGIPHAINFLLEAIADPAKNRAETVPGHLAGALWNAAFSGHLYPETILQRAVERYRCEIGKCNDEEDGWITRERCDARAALIKAVLNRKKHKDTENFQYL